MTYLELLQQGIQYLTKAEIEDAAFDARELLFPISGLNRSEFHQRGMDLAPPEVCRVFMDHVKERASGRPLQYILGDWDFYGYTFLVGEGALIPRPETEQLVDVALRHMKSHSLPKDAYQVVDLCAGTGCVGLTIALEEKQCHVTEVEKSLEAFSFLERNCTQHALEDRVDLQLGDMLEGPKKFGLNSIDVIVSNPPYIASLELATLQAEVQLEPSMALDGGEDGLLFYRSLASQWLPVLKPSGLLAVEIGEDQGKAVLDILRPLCHKVSLEQDFSGLDRVVWAVK